MPLHLYHCTTSAGLRGILTSKTFLPSYCLEKAEYLNVKVNLLCGSEPFAFPMACSADLLDAEVNLINCLKKYFIKRENIWHYYNVGSSLKVVLVSHDSLAILTINPLLSQKFLLAYEY